MSSHDIKSAERPAPDAALVAIAARVQAHFHYALAYRRFITKCRDVTDGVDQERCPQAMAIE